MANREKIAPGEYYHVYNRGVDKRKIVLDQLDSERFVECLMYFNSKEPVKSLRSLTPEDKVDILQDKSERLVEIICYCLNPNHFHLLLKELEEGGISEFIKRLGGGYTWYFNSRHKRSGALFQGKFKYVRVVSNEQLLHLSSYINLNNKVHQYSGPTAVLVRSSWQEYLDISRTVCFCEKNIILGQFKNTSHYKNFADSSLKEIIKLKTEVDKSELIIGKYLFV